jgi:hypothetical protein
LICESERPAIVMIDRIAEFDSAVSPDIATFIV